jgi:hypothetical protein
VLFVFHLKLFVTNASAFFGSMENSGKNVFVDVDGFIASSVAEAYDVVVVVVAGAVVGNDGDKILLLFCVLSF